MNKFDDEHYWEIGKGGYPLRKVMGEALDSISKRLIGSSRCPVIGSSC